MGEVIPFMQALPKVEGDERIIALHRAFGRNPFTLQQAVDVLDISYNEARTILALDPIFDARWRVSAYGSRYWLLPSPLDAQAVIHWRRLYAPIARRLMKDASYFTNIAFAKEAGIPFATANHILSLLVKDGLLTVTMPLGDGAPRYSLKKRRLVIRVG